MVTHSSTVHGVAELDMTERLHTFLCELSLSATEEIRENWREVERQKTKEGYRHGDENRSELRHPPAPRLEALCQCESTSWLVVYSIYQLCMLHLQHLLDLLLWQIGSLLLAPPEKPRTGHIYS